MPQDFCLFFPATANIIKCHKLANDSRQAFEARDEWKWVFVAILYIAILVFIGDLSYKY